MRAVSEFLLLHEKRQRQGGTPVVFLATDNATQREAALRIAGDAFIVLSSSAVILRNEGHQNIVRGVLVLYPVVPVRSQPRRRHHAGAHPAVVCPGTVAAWLRSHSWRHPGALGSGGPGRVLF